MHNPSSPAQVPRTLLFVLSKSSFLLAKLQLDYILSNYGDIRGKLLSPPQSLSAAYKYMLSRILENESTSQHLALRTVSWVFYATRPLEVAELCHLLGTEAGKTDLDWENLPQPQSILDACEGLVTFDEANGVARFFHHTVRDFVKAECETLLLPISDVAKTCLAYLSFDVFNEGPCVDKPTLDSRVERYEASDFVCKFWSSYARRVDESPDVQIAILEVLASENRRESMLQIESYIDSNRTDISFTEGQTLVHVLARAGLSTLCGRVLDENDILDGYNSFNLHTDLSVVYRGNEPPVSRSQTSIFEEDDDGRTSLHFAVREGHDQIVDLLITRGANVDVPDKYGQTPLHWAAKEGHDKTVRLLLDAGAAVKQQDNAGRTALHCAAWNAQDHIVEMVLDAGVDVMDSGKWTALHEAACCGHVTIVDVLLKKKAFVNPLNHMGRTPLHLAAMSGHNKVLQLLLRHGAEAKAPDNIGLTALHFATWDGHEKVVQTLLSAGVGLTSDQWRRTPLHGAARNGHDFIVTILLNAKADVAMRDNYGRTALHLAAFQGQEATVRTLLQAGADPYLRDMIGRTALHRTSLGGYEKIVMLLLSAGSDIEARDDDGRTSLHLAAGYGHYMAVKTLLEAGASVSTKDAQGRTALHEASQTRVELNPTSWSGHDDVVRLLLGYRADVGSRDKYNQTALHLAAWNGQTLVARILVAAGANVATRDRAGKTPRQLAEENGHQSFSWL